MAARANPAAATGRPPSLPSRWAPAWAPMMVATAAGRNTSPVPSALSP